MNSIERLRYELDRTRVRFELDLLEREASMMRLVQTRRAKREALAEKASALCTEMDAFLASFASRA